MIRIATLIAAVALATPAAAQIAETSLLSPSRLTEESWIPRPAPTLLRIAQELPAPAPALVAAPLPLDVPAPLAVPVPLAVAAPAPAAPTVAAAVSAPAPLLPAPEERAAPAGPALRRAATVTGDIVRIGDLVDNAGAVAEVAIFRAPDLGQTGSVPAARVRELISCRPAGLVRLLRRPSPRRLRRQRKSRPPLKATALARRCNKSTPRARWSQARRVPTRKATMPVDTTGT